MASWTQHETWYGKVRVDPCENFICAFGIIEPKDHIFTHGAIEFWLNTHEMSINDGRTHMAHWEYHKGLPWVIV